MVRTRRNQPSLALVVVLALLMAMLFAWSTRRKSLEPGTLQAATVPGPVDLPLEVTFAGAVTDAQPAALPPVSASDPLQEDLAPLTVDPDWCSDRVAEAVASLPPDDGATHAPYFFVLSDDPSVEQLPLKSTRADVDIAGIVADVVVTQIYRNDGDRPIEAIYLFPASTRAAVHALTMTVGDRVIAAEIREAEQAREEYEAARSKGKTASLLEQHRPNVMQMMVANILPGEEVKVELAYAEPVTPRDGEYEFVFPTVVGPRYAGGAASSDEWLSTPFQREGEDAYHTFGADVSLRSAVPLAEVDVPSHAVDVQRSGAREARVHVADSSNAGNRDLVLRYSLAGDALHSGLLLYPGHDENFFLLTVAPPARVPTHEVLPREVVFIVDVSGSMHGFPLDVSKELMTDLLAELTPRDHFNILLFAGGSAVLSETSLPATDPNVALAGQFMDEQTGGGGTELLPALERALALPRVDGASRVVVVATDGYVAVEKEAFELVEAHLGSANMFAFGIGTSVNRFLVEGLARAGRGDPVVVLDEAEARQRARGFRQRIEAPVLSNVKVQFDGFDAYDLAAEQVNDLFAGRPVTLLGKYRGDAVGRIVVRGDTAAGPFEAEVHAARGKLSTRNGALRTLWARERVATLADYQHLAPDDARLAEVTRLGLTYGLLTETTSFVAVDRLVRTHTSPSRIKQPQPMPAGVSNLAVGSCAAVGADGEMMGGQYGSAGFGARGHGKGGGGSGYGSGYGSGGGYLGAKGNGRIGVVSGDPVVMGSLDRDVIDRVIRQHLAEIRYCYRRQLQMDWDLEGRVAFRFVIAVDGSVVSVEVVESDLGNPIVEDCIARRLRRLSFPMPDGGGVVVVTYPFVFSPREEA